MELIKNIINDSMLADKKCCFCGKPYIQVKKKFGNSERELVFTRPQCDCEELARQEEEKKQQEFIAKERAKESERLKRIKAEKMFKNSMITPFFQEKTFKNLKETPEIKRCKEYVNNFRPKASKGIQMFGEPGTGKTTALAAVCNELLSKEYSCLFTPLSTLLDKFSNYSYEHYGDITGLLDWLVTFDFVVLDDIGRETYTDKRKENVFRIIDTLLNYKVVTAFTANPNMIVKLKSIPELEAALDRLKDMCPIKFEFKCNSYRGRSNG